MGFGGIVLSSMLYLTFNLTPAERRQVGMFHLIFSYALGAVVVVLLVLCILGGGVVGHYFLTLMILLAISATGFLSFAADEVLHW